MIRRVYEGAADVDLLQAFNAVAISATDGCGYMHPGDVAHRLFNGNKFYDPTDVLTIWEYDGAIAAWALASPRQAWCDAQVRPDLRDRSFERSVLEYVEGATVALIRRDGVERERLEVEAYRCDRTRAGLLRELGWVSDGKPPYVLNRMHLVELPEPQVPEGYQIRRVHGVEEAGALGAVHAASFGSTWTEEMYRKVMESPGYAPDREFVVEAPDGTLAAFTVTWHDPVNHAGLFEPVGTHPDHRRLGLGGAMLCFALLSMASAGMQYATVVNEGANEASRALYHSVGFEPWHLLDTYTKPL